MTLCQHYPARLVCRLLDFPRCQLYRHASPPADEESQLRAVLIRLAGEWPTYGYRRLTKMLRREGHLVNSKRVRRLRTYPVNPITAAKMAGNWTFLHHIWG